MRAAAIGHKRLIQEIIRVHALILIKYSISTDGDECISSSLIKKLKVDQGKGDYLLTRYEKRNPVIFSIEMDTNSPSW